MRLLCPMMVYLTLSYPISIFFPSIFFFQYLLLKNTALDMFFFCLFRIGDQWRSVVWALCIFLQVAHYPVGAFFAYYRPEPSFNIHLIYWKAELTK